MNFRRLMLALYILSLGHMVFGQAIIALAASKTKVISRFATEDPCADEETKADCTDEETFSQTSSNEEGMPPIAIIRSASDCESNSCTGLECFNRGSCGSAIIHLSNKMTMFSPEPAALDFDFVSQTAQVSDPSPPIRPPIS